MGFLYTILFSMFNNIQHRQICLCANLLIVSRSLFVKEFQLLNKIQSIDFNDAIGHPNLAFNKPNIRNLLHHTKASSRHVLAFGSSQIMQREEILNMINFFGMIFILHLILHMCMIHFLIY